jgi:thymidylate kinase
MYENNEKCDPECAVGQLLRDLFNRLDREGVVYAVLRNYTTLPDKPGRDLDILTNDYEKFHKILRQLAEQHHYYLKIFRRYASLVKFQLIRLWPEDYKVVEIDVGWDIQWKGLPLISNYILNNNRLWRKEFYTLQPGPEAAISLIKGLIGGAVQERYKPEIMEMIRMDKDGFLRALAPVFGITLASELAEMSLRSEWDRVDALAPQLRRQAVIRALRHRAMPQIGRWAAFLWWNLWKFFRPSGLFVVLIGPDGSGKSTISAGLQKCLSPLFQGGKCFHAHFKNLPTLRDLARILGYKVVPEAHKNEPVLAKLSQDGPRLGRIHSLIMLLYYTLDYLLGYPLIIRSRGQGELIIFDRYFYDYLIQSSLSLPYWLLNLMMRLIPKPDMVVYLKNRPEVILSRKPELTRQELERQGGLCAQLISRLPQGKVVETTGTAGETTAKVAQILVAKICGQK